MDIQLNDGISFEIFDSVKITTPIVFTTAFNEYAIKAFKVNSVDYLLKPYTKEDLQAAIEKYRNLHKWNWNSNNVFIFLKKHINYIAFSCKQVRYNEYNQIIY